MGRGAGHDASGGDAWSGELGYGVMNATDLSLFEIDFREHSRLPLCFGFRHTTEHGPVITHGRATCQVRLPGSDLRHHVALWRHAPRPPSAATPRAASVSPPSARPPRPPWRTWALTHAGGTFARAAIAPDADAVVGMPSWCRHGWSAGQAGRVAEVLAVLESSGHHSRAGWIVASFLAT